MAALSGKTSHFDVESPLQQHLLTIREGLLRGDEEEGNGGIEVLQETIEFCRHRPPSDFKSVRQYLDYRYEDVGSRQVGFLIPSPL